MNKERMPKSAALSSLGALLAVALTGCGSDDMPDEAAEAETADSADVEEPSGDDVETEDDGAAEPACDLPADLLERLNLERQLVLNLAMAEGGNLESVESVGTPEPETFRSLADALDGLDLSAISSNQQFDEPDDLIGDLNETADLLEAALAAGTDAADPAWQALSDFYTQEFFVRHNASVGYYLTEAGCV